MSNALKVSGTSLVQHDDYLPLFNRQRRNLIVTSLLLVIAKTYGLSYPKLNILGNELEFNFPVDVGNVLIWATLYFLLRYYQFFKDMGDKNIKSTHKSKSIDFAKLIAMKKFKRDYKVQLKEKRIFLTDNYSLTSDDPWIINIIYTDDSSAQATPNPPQLHQQYKIERYYNPFIWLEAWVNIIFGTRLITEYILPYIISGLTILFYILKTHNII